MANKRPPGNRPPPRRPSTGQPDIVVRKGSAQRQAPPQRQAPSQRQTPPQRQAQQQAPTQRGRSPTKAQPPQQRRQPPPKKKSSGRKRENTIQQQRRNNQIDATQRRRRKRYKRNYTLHYILLTIFLLITGTTLSLTVFFNISTITITGTSFYTSAQVQEVLEAKAGDNLLRLNAGALEDTLLKKLVHAESVQVKRKLPETLSVEVVDGVVTRQLYKDGLYYLLSAGGRMMEKTSSPVPNIPIIVGPDAAIVEEGAWVQTVLTKEDNDSLTIISNEVELSGLKDIPVINISNLVDIRIYYQNRLEIKLGSFSELPDKLAAVYTILQAGDVGLEEHGVIDATDADRIIINNQAEPEMPEGISPEGWTWEDPVAESAEGEGEIELEEGAQGASEGTSEAGEKDEGSSDSSKEPSSEDGKAT